MVADRMRIRAVDLADILAYVVILGLFVQLFPQVISESFSLTLLTALLMKAALEIIMAAKTRAVAGLTGAHTLAARAVAGVAILLLLPGSKYVILWATDAAFRRLGLARRLLRRHGPHRHADARALRRAPDHPRTSRIGRCGRLGILPVADGFGHRLMGPLSGKAAVRTADVTLGIDGDDLREVEVGHSATACLIASRKRSGATAPGMASLLLRRM